ncbi:MAG: 23S rRNA (uracil(1939)-C(5))-methyltransferase RlmD [Candidatus Margulisbacteria bacterium]|nr:23S rRNA (uracil(1939)-C(5))-methyltransferase RlmD [Candidatus Margulisiibacteriota bacterium]MBU1022133.1 23S rRNA (uracil(1939)-C(5))-methyltransferase RlmD [Candidatus Margulisiibacteriota bacterium]MBU1729428.1 23S rRNA (uracil(1939)-C(5))-methyltransferase RlmD [Candidatus Margulisiibacteriota bacterium]
MFKPGNTIKLEITDFAAGGVGLAKKNGFPIFVEGSAIGDVILAEITFAKKDFAEAKIKELITPSKDRCKPRCKHFPDCGGCSLQHISYEAQVDYKHRIISDTLSRTAKIDPSLILPMIPASSPWFYRNKIQLPFKRLKRDILMGYFKPGTHQVVDMDVCFVQEEELTRIARVIRGIIREFEVSIYDEDKRIGILRHLVVRGSNATGEMLVGFIINAKNLPFEKEIVKKIRDRFKNVVGVLVSVHQANTNVILGNKTKVIWGRDHYIDQLGDFKFKVSFPSFYQVNSKQTEVLYDQILKLAGLKSNDIVIDAYAGVGTIAAWVASRCKEVYGIEEIEEACFDAEENMQMNHIYNVKYGQGRVEEIFQEFKRLEIKSDVVILDPPRAGCSAEAIQSILKAKPKKIIYVSCAPPTLARDLKKFIDAGYTLKAVQPVDMFPHTPHIESVSLLC